jgi:prolyl-tRNA synthetase
MAHGDDQGLRLPPLLAPIQLVVVPIWRSADERQAVMSVVQDIADMLGDRVRLHIDDREERPGWKFNEWEVRGVPLRLELGPRDVAAGTAVLARRDLGARETVARADLVEAVPELLADIQRNLLAEAEAFVTAHTHPVSDYAAFRLAAEAGGFITAYWAGTTEDEAQIAAETGATVRCLPLDQPDEPGTCFYTGRETPTVAVFARAY